MSPAPATCSGRIPGRHSHGRITAHPPHGALAAAEVIQHIGARPAVSLKSLAAENGLPV